MTGQDIRKFLDKYRLGNAKVTFDGYPPEFEFEREGDTYKYILCEDGKICRFVWGQNPDHPDWHGWTELASVYMEVE